MKPTAFNYQDYLDLIAENERLKAEIKAAILLLEDTMRYIDGDCAVCDNGTQWCEWCDYKDKWKFIFHDRYETIKEWRGANKPEDSHTN